MISLKGKRVLITGGLGFIGSNLAHRCLDLGAEVTIYDCLDPKSGGNLYNIHDIRDSVHKILDDIRHFEPLCAAILHKDILFNCAAFTSHPNSMKEPLIDIDVNCKGVINILEAARRFNRDVKIVHVGTSTQIGRMIRKPIDETHPEFPADIYSANKTASEKYVLIYGGAYKLRTTVLRLANVYGPRSNIRSADFGFMNYFIGLALQDRDISVFGRGEQLRNISFVDDAVDALIRAAGSEKSDGRVFFAGADRQYNVADIAKAIVKYIGSGSIRRVAWPRDREAIEIGDVVIRNALIKRILGWKPRVDLKTGLLRTRDYYRPRLRQYLD